MYPAQSFAEINRAAIARYPELLLTWLPGGRVRGKEYECADSRGGEGKSFKVNLESGVWKEFNGDEGGGDPISLYAHLNLLSQGEAGKRLAVELGVVPSGAFAGNYGQSNGRSGVVWTAISPVPNDATPPTSKHPRHGKPTARWSYFNASGQVLGYAVRFESSDGNKDVLPQTYCESTDGGRGWRWQAFPVPRPLYGLDRLAQAASGTGVLISEGEKATDAAHEISSGGLVCMTWPGGCCTVNKADWSPLKGRRVCIWPDADKAGFVAAITVAERLSEVGAASVQLVVPSENALEGWDLADAKGWGWGRLYQEIKHRKTTPKEFGKVALERYGIERSDDEGAFGPHSQAAFPDPVSLDVVDLPELEGELIPGPLAPFCQAVADSVQVPIELVLSNALAAVATAVQGKAEVQVTPGYVEPLNIYQLCALPPGERKSAVVERCKAPLVRWEAEKRAELAEPIRRAKSERETIEQAISQKRKAAAQAKDNQDRERFLQEIRMLEDQLPEIPVAPRLLVDDVTAEALAEVMAPQGGRIAIIEAEAGVLDTLGGRYANGVANLDLVLKAWGQEAVHVDRRSHDPIVIDRPSLTLSISPQPGVIADMKKKPEFRGRGLVGRFLFWLPKSMLGSRSVDTAPIQHALLSEYDHLLRRLLDWPPAIGEMGKEVPHVLHLDNKARLVRHDFAASVEKELGEGGEFEHMTDWAGKLPGQAVRLAGLLHCTLHDRPYEHAIDESVMEAAVGIAAVLVAHTKAALNLMGVDPGLECAKAIWAWIKRERLDSFTARNALSRVKGRFPTMKEVEPGLSILQEYGLVKEQGGNKKAGRPSRLFFVNPKAQEV